MIATSAVPLSGLALDVRAGLTAFPKTLPAKLFYDAEGSALFDQITRLPEYYLTRTERQILERHAPEMVRAAGDRLAVLELGAGTADKTRVVLDAILRRQLRVPYHPIDVSVDALRAAEARLRQQFRGVAVRSLVADYTQSMPAIHGNGHRKLALYLGSSIGNFDPPQAAQILRSLRERLKPGDALLLGADLRKAQKVLLPAYNDAQGVTARFNLNVLARINRELGADFALDRFRHVAEWNPRASRMEMHLESACAQAVAIPGAQLAVDFAAGERIHTENSYKYTPAMIRSMLRSGGFTPERTWTDEQKWFAVHLARV